MNAKPNQQVEAPSTPPPPSVPVDPPVDPGPPEMPAEMPAPPPVDPSAVGTDAVRNTPTGKKTGWQQPPAVPTPPSPDVCAHMAKPPSAMLYSRAVGHEWVCWCGQEFVVVIGDGGNKILKEKPADVEGG